MSSTQKIRSYIIYNPVYRQIKKYIKRQTGQRNFIVNTWNVCLYARDDILDMKLVWVRADSQQFIQFIDRLVRISDSFLLWQKFPNIVVSQENYNKLKDFIVVNRLWKFIHKIETKTNLAIIRSTIKVITFHPRILEKNILMKYDYPKNFNGHHTQLYIAEAYDWLTPDALKHFAVKNRYRYTHVVLYLLLDYYRTQLRKRNIRVLNLFDLCSLRLAMFDPRYYQFDQCEIPGLIHTELRRIIEREQKFNNNFVFDSTAYLIENGVHTVPHTVAEYFLFYVSSYTNLPINIPSCNDFSTFVCVRDYVRLYTEEFYAEYLIDFIEKRPYLKMWIDGRLAAMSANLIRKILGYQNVFGFEIDTNYAIVFDEIEPIEFEKFDDSIKISFTGDNGDRVLETCLTHLKTFLTFRPYTLSIKTPVSDYSFFNDIPATNIQFLKHDITAEMILQLMKTERTETSYIWKNAKLTNDPTVLEILHGFQLKFDVQIVQDENTFELIFVFIQQQFQKLNVTEFEFKDSSSYSVLCKYTFSGLESELKLNDYTFRMNELGSKIDMFDRISGKVIDLYEFLYIEKSDDIDFEFYQ